MYNHQQQHHHPCSPHPPSKRSPMRTYLHTPAAAVRGATSGPCAVSRPGAAASAAAAGAAGQSHHHHHASSAIAGSQQLHGAAAVAGCGGVRPFQAGRAQPLRRRRAVAVTAQALPDKLTATITGATGLVGSRLAAKLASQGNRVRVISRNPTSARGKLQYPGLEFYSLAQTADAVRGADAVVNLAGEPIGTRWTPEIKKQIKASRLDVTGRVASAISTSPEGQRPSVFVSSSAVGYYGSSSTNSFTEDSGPGSDYLAEICKEWEAAAQAVPSDVRVVIIRTGIVLARDGGVLARMLPIFEIFAGGPLGSGKQWMSWIHRDDLVDLIIDAIRSPSYSGAYNGTAPKPVTMAQLCSAVGGVMGRPSWLPVPDFAITTLLGEGAQVVLEGQKVLPTRAQQAGFKFKYTELSDALRNLLK